MTLSLLMVKHSFMNKNTTEHAFGLVSTMTKPIFRLPLSYLRIFLIIEIRNGVQFAGEFDSLADKLTPPNNAC